MSHKHLFSRALAAAPERLHFAAHSHHLWPDASHDGHLAAWEVAARLADNKWDEVLGKVWSEAQGHVTRELSLPDPATIAFSANTHDFIVRIMSALPMRPVQVLATDGEFHSFRRQMARWVEAGEVVLETVPPAEFAAAVWRGGHDLIFASHVLFASGTILPDLELLAAVAKPEGPWVVIDGYHGFMAVPTDLSHGASHLFYLTGGYKYAMSGEGLGILHAPPGFAMRPAVTGWFAEFDDLKNVPGVTSYAPDARRFLGATFEPSGLYRFNAVRRMLAAEGLTTATISEHVTTLQRQFVTHCPMPGLELLNPPGNALHARFLAYRGERAPALYRALADQGVVTDLRGDVIRIGFALYHDESDVDRLTAIVNMLGNS